MSCSPWKSLGARGRSALALLAVLAMAGPASAQVTVKVVDDNGLPVTAGFRWMVEEDNTYGIKRTAPGPEGRWAGQPQSLAPAAPQVPGTPAPAANWGELVGNPTHTLSVNVHKSHAPVVCNGDTNPANAADGAAPIDQPGADTFILDGTSCPGFDPSKNYFISILPWHTAGGGNEPAGYTMSGRNIAAFQPSVLVVVHGHPQPTALVTVLVFEDIQPINGAYDQPEEHGLANFTLLLSDPAGQVLQDAFAYPVGTTYKYETCGPNNPRPCKNGVSVPQGEQPNFLLDDEGSPIVDFLGDGTLLTCPGPTPGNNPTAGYTPYQRANCVDPYTLAPLDRGEAVIRYLSMNKYAIEPVPPPRGTTCLGNSFFERLVDCSDMLLTATLEGTRQNDVWVRASEPRYNIVLGNLNWLVFYGFVHPANTLRTSTPGPHTGRLTGQVVGLHDMHPPRSPGSEPGLPVPDCFVGLNYLSGNDQQVYTAPCNPDSTFNITGIGPGTYELVMWDKSINTIIDFRVVTIGPGQTVNMGKIPVFSWFARLTGHVFYDANGDALPRGGVPVNPDLNCPPGGSNGSCAVPNVPINLHFSDGSIIATTVTGTDGSFSFDQYFAWWRYTVLEVGAGLGKPTGLISVVDNGGPLGGGTFGQMGINPQRQPTGQNFRRETGDPVGATTLPGPVTEAVQLFQDMTDYIAFGIQNYNFARGENGGIRGFVDYATTRTEEDPKTSASDGWEPGVPNVTMHLYRAKSDCTIATPFEQCIDPSFPTQTTVTDSWNDNQPTGCVSDPDGPGANLWPIPETVHGKTIHECAETFKNWDQTRPGVFDGAFSFDVMRGANGQPLTHPCPDAPNQTCSVPIPPGNYIVTVDPPRGYQVLFWGDRNIEFGDPEFPFLTQPAECVGAPTAVPQFHTLFPGDQVPTDTSQAGVDWHEGLQLRACDKKFITLNPGATAQLTFNIFTMVPKSARIWGTVWNDLMLEFNPDSPNASGNLAVGHLPVAIKDWKGTEVARFYTDENGHFDGLVNANYDIVPPIPLGLVLSMLTIAPNDPGPIYDTRPACGSGAPPPPGCTTTPGQWITDPWYNPAYSQEVIRENWEFYPGRTTFIDTIVLPVGGFVGNRVPLNCAFTDHTPEFKQITPSPIVSPLQEITLTSKGTVQVPNPNFDPTALTGINSQALISWDHGWGTTGGQVTVGGTPLAITHWDALTITATIPEGGASGQLVVTRGDNGLSTTVGITLYPAASTNFVDVFPPPGDCVGVACARIQPAIDAAPNGTVLLLHPGSYQEHVILWKPVTLQGLGAGVTVFDGTAALGNIALSAAQNNRIQTLIGSGAIAIPPGQSSNYTLQQGAIVLVAGCGNTPGCGSNSFFGPTRARIDGLTLTGANEGGGGVLVNSYTQGLQITNDEILGNQGGIGGGIRAGEPVAPTSFNYDLFIDHNRIAQNGSLFSGGGGIALYSGSNNYQITNNFICGNFSQQYGGGIGHFGLVNGQSPGLIRANVIVSNESFDEGGGIHIGGENAAGAAALSAGAGSVIIDRNLIEGNKSGDDGAGIRTRRFNGLDVASNRGNPAAWYQLDVYNNMIVNNSSADQGGGMSFDDTVRANVVGNTIARNDSTATGSDAFGGPCTENSPIGQLCPAAEAIGGLTTSIPQVAGIASNAHTDALWAALSGPGSYCSSHLTEQQCSRFSNPQLRDDIVWQNRSFYWDTTANNGLGGLVPANVGTTGSGTQYWDFAVYGLTGSPNQSCNATNCMAPTFSILTNGVGAFVAPGASDHSGPGFNPWPGTPNCPTNPNATPAVGPFSGPYCNYYQATSKGAALGNFVVATFTPNGVQGNYHIADTSPAVSLGSGITEALQNFDYDNTQRVAPVDIGADQTSAPRRNTAAGLVARVFNFFRIFPVSWGQATAHPVPAQEARRIDRLPEPAARFSEIVRPTSATAPVTEVRAQAPPSGSAITVSPSSLEFGSVAVGKASRSHEVTVRNNSSSAVSIGRHFFASDDFRAEIDGKVWNEGKRTVPANGTLTLKVSFAPQAVTSVKARSLLIFDTGDAWASPPRVSLGGMAR